MIIPSGGNYSNLSPYWLGFFYLLPANQVLLALEQKQDERLKAAEAEQASVAVMVSGEEEAEALALLKDSALAERIISDSAACGVVGESTNLLTGYLAATSKNWINCWRCLSSPQAPLEKAA